jgi:hypothetical protein
MRRRIHAGSQQSPQSLSCPANSTIKSVGVMRRRIHACDIRRRMHACHMRRRIHAC